MRRIFLADLHLTDNSKDRYRWGIFPWLKGLIHKHDVGEVWILGDLTDKKDNHDSAMTNALVSNLVSLAKNSPVFILRGNHDFRVPDHAFFQFLANIDGITWIDTPRAIHSEGTTINCFPNLTGEKDPLFNEWHEMLADVKKLNDSNSFNVFHQCLLGAVSQEGQPLKGADVRMGDTAGVHLAGDIHNPQIVQGIEYVGSPYPITFNTTYTPRGMLFNDLEYVSDLHMSTISKLTLEVESLAEIRECCENLIPGDQIKLRVYLSQDDLSKWPSIRSEAIAICASKEIYLKSIELKTNKSNLLKRGSTSIKSETDYQILERFSESRKIGNDFIDFGKKYLYL